MKMNRLGKRHSGKKKYPVKTTVNLLYREKPPITIPQLILVIAVFAVILVTFGKFAVADRLAASGRALQEAENLERRLAAVRESNSDYEEVLREYQHYYFSAADGREMNAQAYVNCQDVLGLLESEFLNKAGMQMVNLTGDVLTVNLTKINLEEASVIAKSLQENKLVREVLVSAANKQEESRGTTVFLTVILEPEAAQEADAEAEQSAGTGGGTEQSAEAEQGAEAGEGA